MPGGDGTGPIRQGPRTGRCAGFCSGYFVPGYADLRAIHGSGSRQAIRAGGGRGHRHWYYATGIPGWIRGNRSFPWYYAKAPDIPSVPTRSEELEQLKEEAGCFEKALDDIKHRISQLETTPGPGSNQTGG